MGRIFLDVHEAQPCFGAKLVFVLLRHKITLFVHNSDRSRELVDFLTSFRFDHVYYIKDCLKMFVLISKFQSMHVQILIGLLHYY